MAEQHQTDHTDPQISHTDPIGLLHPSDVQALRAADTMTFHTATSTGGFIDAGLSSTAFAQPRIYTTRQQHLFPDGDGLDRRRRIPVTADIAGFDDAGRWHEHDLPGAALAVVPAAHLDEVWRSVTMLLRPGDLLRLHWRADDPSDALDDPALHRDELRLGVTRGTRRWQFLLAVHVLPEPVRMVTRQPRQTPTAPAPELARTRGGAGPEG